MMKEKARKHSVRFSIFLAAVIPAVSLPAFTQPVSNIGMQMLTGTTQPLISPALPAKQPFQPPASQSPVSSVLPPTVQPAPAPAPPPRMTNLPLPAPVQPTMPPVSATPPAPLPPQPTVVTRPPVSVLPPPANSLFPTPPPPAPIGVQPPTLRPTLPAHPPSTQPIRTEPGLTNPGIPPAIPSTQPVVTRPPVSLLPNPSFTPVQPITPSPRLPTTGPVPKTGDPSIPILPRPVAIDPKPVGAADPKQPSSPVAISPAPQSAPAAPVAQPLPTTTPAPSSNATPETWGPKTNPPAKSAGQTPATPQVPGHGPRPVPELGSTTIDPAAPNPTFDGKPVTNIKNSPVNGIGKPNAVTYVGTLPDGRTVIYSNNAEGKPASVQTLPPGQHPVVDMDGRYHGGTRDTSKGSLINGVVMTPNLTADVKGVVNEYDSRVNGKRVSNVVITYGGLNPGQVYATGKLDDGIGSVVVYISSSTHNDAKIKQAYILPPGSVPVVGSDGVYRGYTTNTAGQQVINGVIYEKTYANPSNPAGPQLNQAQIDEVNKAQKDAIEKAQKDLQPVGPAPREPNWSKNQPVNKPPVEPEPAKLTPEQQEAANRAAAEAERQRQAEVDRVAESQRQAEAERQRKAEADRVAESQRQAEAERRERQAEERRAAEREREAERVAESQRQAEAERRERQAEERRVAEAPAPEPSPPPSEGRNRRGVD